MPDFDEYISESFHSLVADAQANELKEIEQRREDERHKMLELRAAAGTGLTASQLLQQLTGDDPEKLQQKLEAEADRIQREAAAAVATKDKTNEQLPADRFPPPILT